MRASRIAIPPILLTLAFGILTAFSLPCDLITDGHGNLGDETTTIALAGTIATRSLPGYGYRPDGTDWKFDVNTAPLYGWFYGAAVGAAPAVRRVDAARLVSKLLGGISLTFIAWCLLQTVFRRRPSEAPLWGQLLLALFVGFVFMNSSSFRFISSFARVDALGFFFLTAVLAAGTHLLIRPGRLAVFLFSLLTLAAAWSSYVAFYLIGFIAAFCLAAVAIEQARGKTPGAALKALFMSVVLPATAALVIFLALSAINRGALLTGPSGDVWHRMVSTLTPSQRMASQAEALARPERWWFLLASLVGFGGLLVTYGVWKLRGRSPLGVPVRLSDLIWIAVAIAGTTAVYALWLLMLSAVPIRFTYNAMITTAFAFLQLIVFSYVLRNSPVERYIMAAVTSAALVYLSFHPLERSLCREDYSSREDRLWPQTIMAGVYNPFDDVNHKENRARRLHAEAVRDYLVQHGVRKTLSAEPMFAGMSDPSVSFFYLNDPGGLSPATEEQLFTRLVPEQAITHIVSTEFGESASLEVAGYVGLRRCLRRAAASVQSSITCDLGGHTLELTRLLKSDDVVHEPGEYRYGFGVSTPIAIYAMRVSPR